MGVLSQMSLPPLQVRRQLKAAVTVALRRAFPAPFVLKPPFKLELEMTTQASAEMLAFLPNVERTSAIAVTTTFESLVRAMRFVAFAMLYSPMGTPALWV
jgi:D-aminopeptidase